MNLPNLSRSVKRGRKPRIDRRKLVELWNANLPVDEIAETLGVSVRAIGYTISAIRKEQNGKKRRS